MPYFSNKKATVMVAFFLSDV
jgi:hypothetical protein